MIITLCGSTRFKEWYRAIEKNLALKGHIVLSVNIYSHHDNIPLTEEEKKELDKLHFKKIDISDAIFIINKGGYIGESTRNEINYATNLGKKIYYLENGDGIIV